MPNEPYQGQYRQLQGTTDPRFRWFMPDFPTEMFEAGTMPIRAEAESASRRTMQHQAGKGQAYTGATTGEMGKVGAERVRQVSQLRAGLEQQRRDIGMRSFETASERYYQELERKRMEQEAQRRQKSAFWGRIGGGILGTVGGPLLSGFGDWLGGKLFNKEQIPDIYANPK